MRQQLNALRERVDKLERLSTDIMKIVQKAPNLDDISPEDRAELYKHVVKRSNEIVQGITERDQQQEINDLCRLLREKDGTIDSMRRDVQLVISLMDKAPTKQNVERWAAWLKQIVASEE